MAIVTPCPGSRRDVKTQRLRRKSKKFATVPVPAPVCPLPLGFLSKQPPPSSASLFSALSGPLFDTLCCQPSSPSPKPQTLSCLQRELQAQPNVNNHSMQRERRIQNTCRLLPGGQHHPSRPFSCGISGPHPRQPAGYSGARQGETSPEV